MEYPPITNHTENLAENQIESVGIGIRNVVEQEAPFRPNEHSDVVLGKVLELVFRRSLGCVLN